MLPLTGTLNTAIYGSLTLQAMARGDFFDVFLPAVGVSPGWVSMPEDSD